MDDGTAAIYSDVDFCKSQMAFIQETVVDMRQELAQVEEQCVESRERQSPDLKAQYAEFQELLAKLKAVGSPFPTALVEAAEHCISRQRSEEDVAASSLASADVAEPLTAEDAQLSSNVLDHILGVFPQHIQAWASGSGAGRTPIVGDEAQGLETLSVNDRELLRWSLRKRPRTDHSAAWPDCSGTLSSLLIRAITGLLTRDAAAAVSGQPRLVLSVGSGSGLLEAHLQNHWSSEPDVNLLIHGVEVRSTEYTTPNRYLLFKNRSSVRGTWEVSSRLVLASALMFVYPRQVDLVKRYLDEVAHSDSVHVHTIVWLGPKSDWEEEAAAQHEGQPSRMTFRRCLEEMEGFGDMIIWPAEESGLPEYEVMVSVVRDTV